MRRTRLYQILICLLCLSPAWSQAQSLSQYEYWFDDNFSDRQTAGLSGYETDIDVGIDARNLGNGLHKLCLRVKQSDGMYSPVTTSYFFKAQVSSGGKLEYWFDGNRKKINTVDCHVSSDGKAYLYTSGLDLTAVTPGYHTMYYRFVNDDGTTSSAVSVSSVFVTPDLSDGGKLEYWFDGNRKNIYTVEGKVSSDGKGYIINSGLDLTAVSPGHHTMYYRFTNGDGSMSSAVSMSSVFVTPNLTDGGKLEYWFDDDRENVSTVDGKVSSDSQGLIFNSDLDLKDVSEGMHRMYYRLLDTKGKPNSAVSMTPLMVKSKYNDISELKVTKYAVSVDNEEPLILDVSSPQETITIPYTLDARRFSIGNHTLTAKFWNSIGTNITEQSTFNVVAQETPTITLSATEKEGYVSLVFNSIPNDVHYVVGRKDENGKARKVYETYNSNYPNNISVVDNPVAGSYTYYVRAVYTDSEETPHGISSNEIPLIIEDHSAATPKGCIVGRVIFGEQEIDLISTIRKIYVEFSDGDEKARIEPNGTFYRDGIPLGTKLTISIPDDDYYTYEKVELEVTEDTRNEVQIIKATRRDDNSVQVSNTNHDLVITSLHVNESQDEFNLRVQNISGHTWRGNIKLIAVRTEDLENNNSDQESGFPLTAFKTYYNAGSIYIHTITNGEIQSVTIQIKGLPSSDEGENYSFYIISNERGEENCLKMLDCNISGIANPFRLWIEGGEHFNYYAMMSEQMFKDGVAEILSMMKKMDKGVGPFTYALKNLTDDLQGYDIGNLPDILKYFSEDLKNAVADVKGFTDLIGSAKKFFDYVNTFEIFNGDDYTAKFTKFSQIVTDWAFDGNPIAKIYSQYFEAVEHAYDVANGWSKTINDVELGLHFDDHTVSIIVEVDGWWGDLLNSFKAKDVQKKIVKAELHMRQGNNWSHRLYTAEVSGADVFLKYAYDLSSHQDFNYGPIDEFYMDVYWEGDLLTTVWLLDDTKVKYELDKYRVKFKSKSSRASNMTNGLHWQPYKE